MSSRAATSPVRGDLPGSLNALLAADTLRYVRTDLYCREGAFKSWNKSNLFKDPLEEYLRVHWAGLEYATVGGLPSQDTREHSSRVWRSRSQVCASLAQAAEDKLWELDRTVPISRLELGGLHAVTLVGRLPYALLGKPMTEWPPDTAICDPWANIACAANQYPERFRNKMFKWYKDGKVISFHGDWHSPLDQVWLNLTESQRTQLVRSEGADGAVEYTDQRWHGGPRK